MLTKLSVPLGMCLATAMASRLPAQQLPQHLESTSTLPVQAPVAAPADPQGETLPPAERRAACAPVTARQLGSMLLKDAEGDVVAKVQDLVIDPCSGRIVYAAISFGQMVGMGDVLYVVPWEYVETLAGSHELRLTIAPDLVKRGPRFAMSSWPNFADRDYAAAVQLYYAEAGASPRVIQARAIVR